MSLLRFRTTSRPNRLYQRGNPCLRREQTSGLGRRPSSPLSLEPLESRNLLATYMVDPPLDVVDSTDGVTTLREAIIEANASPNVDALTPDRIEFYIPGTGPHTIQPLSGLPAIGDGVLFFSSNDNVIQGNLIGTDISGGLPLGNRYGVNILDSSTNNLIGGTTEGARNVISGNAEDGVSLSGGGDSGNDASFDELLVVNTHRENAIFSKVR